MKDHINIYIQVHINNYSTNLTLNFNYTSKPKEKCIHLLESEQLKKHAEQRKFLKKNTNTRETKLN